MKLETIKLKAKSGDSIKLTIEEAKELYNQLDDLFGVKYTPSTPIYIDRTIYPWNQSWYGNNNCSLIGDSGLTVSYLGDNS